MQLIPPFIHRRIAHRPNLVRIVDNVAWLFVDKILRMGVGLLVGVWVARYLGPEHFGQFNFAQALVGMFGVIAGMGLQGIVVRDPSGVRSRTIALIHGIEHYSFVIRRCNRLGSDTYTRV